MKKIHTRMKRHYRIRSHNNTYSFFHPKPALHQPKTFATEEGAHRWAQERGFMKGTYELKAVKQGKRLEVAVNKQI